LILFSFMTPRPPISTLFPYTTLFRSAPVDQQFEPVEAIGLLVGIDDTVFLGAGKDIGFVANGAAGGDHDGLRFHIIGLEDIGSRSEEHTSELQSRENLVCRLLLEKKK